MIEAGKTYRFYGDQVVTVHAVTGLTYSDGRYVEVDGTYLRKDGKQGQRGVRVIPADATEVSGR